MFVYKWPADKENDTGIVSQHSMCDVKGKRRIWELLHIHFIKGSWAGNIPGTKCYQSFPVLW